MSRHPLRDRLAAAAQATGHSYAECSRVAEQFDRVLHAHPRLTAYGMGIFDRPAAPQQRRAEFDRERQHLRDEFVTVARVYFWLSAEVGMIKTPTQGSYRLKHVAEEAIGVYVANGEFIAAALTAGYPMRELDGPNPLFGVRKRDVEAAIARADSRVPGRLHPCPIPSDPPATPA
jgi:hypothetical protein